MTATFQANAVFVLDDGTEIPVCIEQRSDFVAFEADETSWYTVMGKEDVWWTCRSRKINRIKSVRILQEPS